MSTNKNSRPFLIPKAILGRAPISSFPHLSRSEGESLRAVLRRRVPCSIAASFLFCSVPTREPLKNSLPVTEAVNEPPARNSRADRTRRDTPFVGLHSLHWFPSLLFSSVRISEACTRRVRLGRRTKRYADTEGDP